MTFQGHFGDLLAVVTLSAQLTRSLPAIYKLLVLKSGSLISHLLYLTLEKVWIASVSGSPWGKIAADIQSAYGPPRGDAVDNGRLVV